MSLNTGMQVLCGIFFVAGLVLWPGESGHSGAYASGVAGGAAIMIAIGGLAGFYSKGTKK